MTSIEVVIDLTGDNAEAESAEDAIFTALTLMQDDNDHHRIAGRTRQLTASFFVNGRFIRQANYQTLCKEVSREVNA